MYMYLSMLNVDTDHEIMKMYTLTDAPDIVAISLSLEKTPDTERGAGLNMVFWLLRLCCVHT